MVELLDSVFAIFSSGSYIVSCHDDPKGTHTHTQSASYCAMAGDGEHIAIKATHSHIHIIVVTSPCRIHWQQVAISLEAIVVLRAVIRGTAENYIAGHRMCA